MVWDFFLKIINRKKNKSKKTFKNIKRPQKTQATYWRTCRREKEINLSNIRQIGQARKDESKIISFFDLFDDEEKINESEQANSSLKIQKAYEAEKIYRVI